MGYLKYHILGHISGIRGHFLTFRDITGIIFSNFGIFWDIFGRFGTIWGHYGTILGHFGKIWGYFETFLDVLGRFGTIWDILGHLTDIIVDFFCFKNTMNPSFG